MSDNPMVRAVHFFLCAVVYVLCGVSVQAQDEPLNAQPRGFEAQVEIEKYMQIPPPREPQAGDDLIRRTQIARFNAARKFLEATIAFYINGTVTIDRAVLAMTQLADAELALARTTEERISIHERIIEYACIIEIRERERFAMGTGSQPNLSEAEYTRMGAQISLLEAQKAAGLPLSLPPLPDGLTKLLATPKLGDTPVVPDNP